MCFRSGTNFLCGHGAGVSGASESYIQAYLDTLNQFENEYTAHIELAPWGLIVYYN